MALESRGDFNGGGGCGMVGEGVRVVWSARVEGVRVVWSARVEGEGVRVVWSARVNSLF